MTSFRRRAVRQGIWIAEKDLMQSGGAYDLQQVTALMHGISPTAIEGLAQEGSIVAVVDPRGWTRYPKLQFDGDGSLVPGLKAVREALPTDNPWILLNFLVRPDSALKGRRPIDLLKADKLELVLDAARRYGVQGS